jgi:hypothetical protein
MATAMEAGNLEDETHDAPELPEPTSPSPNIEKLYEQLQPYNPAVYSKETTLKFVDYVFQCYKQAELKDEILTERFREDFSMFTRKNWDQIPKARLSQVKTILRTDGCYVPVYTKRGTAADLEDIINSLISWPLDDPKCPFYITEQAHKRRERFEGSIDKNYGFHGTRERMQQPPGMATLLPSSPAISSHPSRPPMSPRPPEQFTPPPMPPAMPEQLSGRLPTVIEMILAA